MPQIFQSGALNTTALIVPDLYVQLVPPQNLVLNGVPTNVIGIVGTAQWGPVNTPVVCGTMGDFAGSFGTVLNRQYDLGTAMSICVLQGAQNFRLVRQTDGTDTAASQVVQTNCITFTAKYTGSLGNSLAVTLSAGSQANSYRAVVSLRGFVSETFDNLATGLTGNAVWVAIAAAINSGTTLRSASNLITAAAGSGTATPASATLNSFTGGTDGVASITDTLLVGTDGSTRTGMYALRGKGCGIAFLADVTTTTTFTTQVAFALSESLYMIGGTAAGDSVSNYPATKNTAGIDSYAFKWMFGDWIYWNDPVNQVTRLVSPVPFAAGRLANLSPEQSSLNKQLYGVVASQKSGLPGTNQTGVYSSADLGVLISAGVDVIANPQPGGAYWGVRGGHNSSSNAATNGDNYTRMTNYIATTVAAGMGIYVGNTITDQLYQQVSATMNGFLQNLKDQNMIKGFNVVCDKSNNPGSRTSLGYVQCDVAVRYLSINEKFIVNIQGGQTVITGKTTQTA
jgi:phage tail sheath protein FI